MSMTVSGKVVKRPGRVFPAFEWERRMLWVRKGKCPASWAGVRYQLTEMSHVDQLTEQGEQQDWLVLSDAARQAVANLDALANRRAGEAAEQARRDAETLTDIRRRYSIVLDEESGTITLTGTVSGDYAVLGQDAAVPRCHHRGTQAHLPAEAYELAAHLWLTENALEQGKEARHAH